MGVPVAPQTVNSLLRSTLKDFCRVAEVLNQHETTWSLKGFYCDLGARCYQLHDTVQDGTTSAENMQQGLDVLTRLQSFITSPHNENDSSLPLSADPRYPGLTGLHTLLASLSSSRAEDATALKKYIDFGAKERGVALIEYLRDANAMFSSPRDSKGVTSLEGDHDLPRKIRQAPPDDVLPAADLLFKALQSKKSCTCDPAHEYVVQLSLETHRAKVTGCGFDLYLGLGHLWQEAHVQTVTAAPEERKRMVSKLCEDITKITKRFPNYRLKFRMEKDCLWKLQSEQSSFKVDKSKAPISLAEFIIEKSNLLNERTKRILSVLLGYAVFHLYDTPWLQSSWGSSNVKFFRSLHGFPLRPYIETRLDAGLREDNTEGNSASAAIDDSDFDPDDLLAPPCPSLVGLAIVLIELHKAVPLEDLAASYGITTGEDSDSAARYILARGVFDNCCEEFTDQTRMAIRACLDPNIGSDENGGVLDDQGLRRVIYDETVRRLEDEMEQGFGDLSVDQLDILVRKLDLATGGQLLEYDAGGSTSIARGPSKKRSAPEQKSGPRVRFRLSSDHDEPSSSSASPTMSVSGSLAAGTYHEPQPLLRHTDRVPGTHSSAPFDMTAPIQSRRPPSVRRPDTVRVLEIPEGLSRRELRIQLKSIFETPCVVHSLAKASRDTQATVTFPLLPNDQLSHLLEDQPLLSM
ncbi:hypothetical protein GGR56DRAFT_242648 [Xylariaceae sp. FL0804]|nr:hypothetical protein GGR56DRAFT_242648 [Xylariaceae sp. FL0804]